MSRNSTAVCGHGVDRRHRVPTSGTLVSGRGTALTAQPLAALGGLGGGRRSDHRGAVRDFWLDITAPPRQPIAVRGGPS